MFRRHIGWIVTCFAILCFFSRAGQPGQRPKSKDRPRVGSQQPIDSSVTNDAIRVQVNLVNLTCSVVDKSSRFVTSLTREDFQVIEDGVPQQIKNFARESNLPLRIALLIDTSESVISKLKFEQEAATRFFSTVLREPDRGLLVEFDSGVTLLQDFTNDVNRLARELKNLRAGGGTSLNDAIYQISDEKLLTTTGRKAIILITDGEDTSSKYSFDEALEMAQRAEATVFAISTNKAAFFGGGGHHGTKNGDRVLTQLTEDTGGKVFFPAKADDLDMTFRQISEELRSQYSVGYISTNTKRDGTYRGLQVKLIDNKRLRIRHRKGYYAPTG
ncbi:MAG: VWA domain-containing protein [Acidobacteria bacterium]|nr:VWA domain-containing protein [Acidobacteriota bacterium]MBI3654869.1 VWA domain-containing protein [Acidobacteriota bacterium]